MINDDTLKNVTKGSNNVPNALFCSICGKKIHRVGYRFPESHFVYCNECVKNEFAVYVKEEKDDKH